MLPNAPVFGWGCLKPSADPSLAAFDLLPFQAKTSSGRAALFWALKALNLPAGSSVLVPAYHCPTMVTPILLAGLRPIFFDISEVGAPALERIELQGAQPGAMICAHYFGLPRSLAAVRAWCDARGIALIEDCAHSFFGMAGDRPVGHWGDFATASITKFFPVPECGLLASSRSNWQRPVLRKQPLVAQIKGLVDVLEISARHNRLLGLNHLVRGFSHLKGARKSGKGRLTGAGGPAVEPSFDADELMRLSDMLRIDRAPLAVSRLIYGSMSRERIVTRRQQNFNLYKTHFEGLSQAPELLWGTGDQALAPYVFPLLIDDAERVYAEARRLGLPVFRWDRLWPGSGDQDVARSMHWSRHLLQLICHQDLELSHIEATSQAILHLLCP